ncbi:unnamed protein product [Cuscuta epithymum]|uniref:DNA-directed RNA polymerase n=1 Tax=Cuscuta epithymum TaxID=186058 RepID=A0AAV0CWE2_9ASTE|nr:unnamed protein product [Cuscuta epithymum]
MPFIEHGICRILRVPIVNLCSYIKFSECGQAVKEDLKVCAYGLQLRMLMTLQEYKLAGHAFRLSFIENTKIKENELSLEHISLGICTTLNVLQKFLICQGG